MTYQPKYTNLVQLMEEATAKYGPKPLFGTHIGHGNWRWTTFKEFDALVSELRGGLASLGVGKGDRVAVISNNRLEWAVAAYATYTLGAAYVAMYESQLDKEWKFIIADSGSKVCFAANAAIAKRLEPIKSEVATLANVLTFDGDGPSSYEGLRQAGRKAPVSATRPDDKDVACLIYTSGTTGNPKGVKLTHYNIAANVSAVINVGMMGDDERSLAFLPWAHVFGGCVELLGTIATGSSAAICDDTAKILEYLPQVQPTMLFAVPRIWNRIYDGVGKQIASKPAIIQAIFHNGMRARSKQKRGEPLTLAERVSLPLAEKLVFSKIRGRFGGRLRFAISGAAALSKEVAEFVDNLGIEVYEGYGMTESSGCTTTNRPGQRKLGSVGRTVEGVSVKIDKSAPGAGEGEGEIIIYGTGVMAGYHNLPDVTKDSLTADGGLRSGDLGRIDADGYVFITGRVKELYKLSNGKYVAPAPLEEKLQLSSYIAQCVIFGEDQTHNVAMIVPDPDALSAWAKEHGVTGDVLANPKTRELFAAEIEKYSTDFKGYEKIKDFFFEKNALTTEGGMLTPTLKLKRRVVVGHYKPRFQSLYGKSASASVAATS